jgi:hypothetical protein
MVQGLTSEQTIARAKETFIPLMKRNLLFWIPVQFGTFGYVEENLQIPVLIVCGLVWTVILSLSAGSVTANDNEVAGEKIEARPSTSASIEAGMRELTVAVGALDMNGTSFFFGGNVSTYSTNDDEEAEKLNSIWVAQNVDNLKPCGLLEEQDACTM